MIITNKLEVPGPVKIHDDIDMLVSDSVYIGEYTVIKSGFRAKCRSLHIGRHCYIHENVEIGFGGCIGPNAHVYIDDYVGIFQNTHINCAETVHIGKHCGIGQEVKIWTHSAWLPVAEGFPPQHQAPVIIGDKVWLPARCQILPGVTIGDNVVVGINSLVNRNLPAGCFAAGIPAKVKEMDAYPKPLTNKELHKVALDLRKDYKIIAQDKGFEPILVVYGPVIGFFYEDERTWFDLSMPNRLDMHGISPYAEDFRDYLRRNGFKFYNGGFFRSIMPERFTRCRPQEINS